MGVGTVAVTEAAVQATSPWTVVVLALVAPVIPVLVGYLLTRSKMKKQDDKVQEIHVLVNSRLSKTLDALAVALTENIRLKEAAGASVTEAERTMARHPEDAGRGET